ncbi:MAG: LexA family transcriptional regulator [Candidatus Gastranaerophilales bacterium]|nr:LexA family transcriptional regulator [Candidatus Gastranaerophilales bacterium]
MKIDEITEILRKKTGLPVNQSMLAKCLGVTRQSVSNRVKNNSRLTIIELEKIEKFFNIKIMQKCENLTNMVNVDFYPEVFASCGGGTVMFSDEKNVVELPKTLFSDYSPSKKYSMIYAQGDSMTPFIDNSDKLIVEHRNNEQIIDNKVYVFCYKSEIFVKRLAKNVDEIIIKSDNPNYSMRYIKGEDMNDLQIIGQIVGIVRNI